jgi:hypothetical protein
MKASPGPKIECEGEWLLITPKINIFSDISLQFDEWLRRLLYIRSTCLVGFK